MITKLMEEIRGLVQKELHRANCDHPPVFASNHEAYAVVKEEYEEAEDCLRNLEAKLNFLWFKVREDRLDSSAMLEETITKAKEVAAEAVQTAAMLVKWQNTISMARLSERVDDATKQADKSDNIWRKYCDDYLMGNPRKAPCNYSCNSDTPFDGGLE